MKKKYCKPTLTSFPVANAAADGFEILGTCLDGFAVGQSGGDCSYGNNPETKSTCNAGSGATGESYSCYGGMFPKSGFAPCLAGAFTACNAGGSP